MSRTTTARGETPRARSTSVPASRERAGRLSPAACATLVAALALLPAVGAVAEPDPPAGPRAVAVSGPPPAGIDDLVSRRLRDLGLAQAPVCSDETFVRRAALDLIGTLPTAAETREFLRDPSPGKRAAWVDRCLAREEFADYWAMKWCNLLRVKSEFPINLWPNAVQAYHRWIHDALRDGLPYDRFARALLTSSGSSFRAPPVNFWRAVQKKDPETLARAVALTFMGARAEAWPRERLAGMAAFFSRVGYKATGEWKEEIVFFDAAKADAPASAVFPDGRWVALPPGEDPREVFADWLVDPENPWFARSVANRVWSWLLGTGIVHEPDDFRDDNPPSNPALLDALAWHLVAAHWDLKDLFRRIATSRAYQSSCVPTSADPRAAAAFASYPVRPLEPEVLIDAIDQVTGTTESYSSRIPEPFTFVPTAQRSIELADASVTSPFLDLFGRSPRDTGLESEQRDSLPTAAQRLHLLNSTHVRRKLEEGPGLRAIVAPPAAKGAKGAKPAKPDDPVETLYLTILSRYPTAQDLAAVEAYRKAAGTGRNVLVDVAWALVNGAEFQYRR